MRLEAADGDLGGRAATVTAIRSALEAAGAQFTKGERPGVRLRAGGNPRREEFPHAPLVLLRARGVTQ